MVVFYTVLLFILFSVVDMTIQSLPTTQQVINSGFMRFISVSAHLLYIEKKCILKA